jgi:uncharacterized protein (DUF2141 family)
VYLDLDGNGARDSGEPAGTSGTDGSYSFTGLRPGAYSVRAYWPAGWTCSGPAPCRHDVTLASGDDAAGRDFAGWRTAAIAGSVTDDLDGDGSVDAGEPGLPGQSVFLDSDGDGTLDAGEPRQATDAHGDYSFDGLRPGAYAVRYVVPSGRTCTSPAPCRRAPALASGETAAGQSFSSHLVPPPPDPDPVPPPDPDPTPDPDPAPAPKPDPAPAPPPAAPAPKPDAGAIAGTAFEDRDADGLERESGEPPLAGWTVYLDTDRDRRHDAGEPATTTDAAGRYELGGRRAGSYDVRIEMASDKWICSLPETCVRHVTIARDGRAGGQDFAAWREARVTGYKFEDGDRDGSDREQGDRPLSGWMVYVDLNRNGRYDEGEPYDFTDENGRYGITNVPLGTMLLREVPPAASKYRCTYPVGDCSAVVIVASGDESQTADFGAVLGVQEASHQASVSAGAACRTGRFRVRVRARLARHVTLRVDGRPRASSSAISRGRYSFRLDARRYRVGVHRVAARVTFLDGSTRTVRATFYRCRQARPRYTG